MATVESPQTTLDILHSEATWDWKREEIEKKLLVSWGKIRVKCVPETEKKVFPA